MLMRRRTMRRFAVWLVMTLLCMQWATASYACPRADATAPATVAMPAMPGCHESAPHASMDPGQPLLCKAHCDHGFQTVNDAPSPQPASPFFPLLWAVLDWHVAAATTAAEGPAAAAYPAVARPPTAPPVYLLLHVFRN